MNRRNQSPDTMAQSWSQPATNFVPGGGAPGGVVVLGKAVVRKRGLTPGAQYRGGRDAGILVLLLEPERLESLTNTEWVTVFFPPVVKPNM